MGGAVSSGRDNNELIDNLMGGNYIRTRDVERVFRALDRADYMTPEARDQAYKDLAWRNGPLHMSAPCIYSEVMEGLELKPGLSFLNIGSGTGYLSTLVGLIIGSGGISHGVEVHRLVVDYANKKLSQFMENSATLDEFDFCEPKFYHGNGLCLAPLQTPYDRVYCGAGCPEEYQNYFQQLIKVGGILVMPLNDNLLQVKRVGAAEWTSRSLLNVSFATLRVPTKEESQELIRLEEQTPARLQALCRAVVRSAMRAALRRRNPQLCEPPPRAPPAKKSCPRRICIPIDDDSDNEGLNALHDLDRATGATEMNALLSLVLSMGHNRVAGALRVDSLDSSYSESEAPADAAADDDGGGDGDAPDDDDAPDADSMSNGEQDSSSDDDNDDDDSDSELRNPIGQKIIMLGFRNLRRSDEVRPDPAQPDDEQSSSHSTPEGSPTKDTEGSASRPDSKSTPTGSKDTGTKDKDTRPKEPRRRMSKGSRRVFRGSRDTAENPDVPSEVEIYLEKTRQAPGTSTMEWEPIDAREENSSEDETETSASKTKEEKRQKLDSGIGEENTPSAGSSPHTAKSESDGAAGTSDEGCDEDVKGRRRRQKRCHLSTRSSSSTDEESCGGGDGAAAGEGEAGADERRLVPLRPPRSAQRDPALERHLRRHKRRLRESHDARRVQLSVLMKRAVKELPLPYALKRYVNLGRCFEF